MHQTSKAKALAEFDAICDEFEQAYEFDERSIHGDDSVLQPWLDRVSPDLRTWLQRELVALRQELQICHVRNHEALQRTQVPSGIETAVWNAVTQCPTFQTLSLEALLALASSIELRDFPSGSVFLRSGANSSGLFLITDGSVSVVAGEGENRQEIDRDGIGSVLGEMSMITGHPCSADVIATTAVEALVLPVDTFDVLRRCHPEIEIALSQLVSDRLGHRSHDALCGKSLGGYRLQRCISGGAMGVVYAAEDESDGSPHALKMLRHRFIYSPRVVSRFDQEADLLSQLEHPHIVSLRDHFVAYRTRFIVLDLYDGADLREVIRHYGPLPERLARSVLGQIAAGLHYAHQCGILHLDLKPANILLDQQGKVAITDFGLGRLIESDGCDHEVVGTPLYMPPEQFSMSDVGPHCDWYSFACIACELVTGERLFQADDSSDFMDQKLRVPSSTWPKVDVSEDFQFYMMAALQPLAEHRDLDLEEISTWARRVPELATVLNDPSFAK